MTIDSGTFWDVHSVVMFCKAFFTSSIGRWADTAAIVQPNWKLKLSKKKITKHHV